MRSFQTTETASPVFNTLFGDVEGLFQTRTLRPQFQLHCDIAESDASIVLHFDVPGVHNDDLNIEFEDGVLTVSGLRRSQQTEESSKDTPNEKVYRERRFGTFSRAFKVPSSVNPDAISASHNHGVLQVELKKTAKPLPKKIEITAPVS